MLSHAFLEVVSTLPVFDCVSCVCVCVAMTDSTLLCESGALQLQGPSDGQ